jgi:O-antigen/teichoic acid export membrane protein
MEARLNPFPKLVALRERLKRHPVGAALLSLVSDSAVYLVGGLLVGLGNVILIPLYTRLLLPRAFGVFALIDVAILIVVTVSLLKMDVSYLKWFAGLNPEGQKELLGSTLLTGLIASGVGGVLLSLLGASHLGEIWLHEPIRNYAWLLLPLVILENLQALLLTDLRARRRAVLYSLAAFFRLAGILFFSYYFMSVLGMGLPGLFAGRLIGDAISIAFLAMVCFHSVVWRFSRVLLGPMLRFGMPLIWSVLAFMAQDAAGRYFLVHYGTLEQVGLLGAAIKISGVFQMLVSTPFGVAWGGILFQIVKQREARVIYSRIFGYVYVFALGMALILTIFGPTLFRIFTAPAYYPAMTLLPLILLVRAMSVVEQPAATGIYLSGRTEIFAAIYTVALAVNLILLYVLVPRYGAIGVAWAWFLGTAVVPILDLFFGQKLYRLTLNAKLILLPVLPWLLIFFGLPAAFAEGFLNHFVIQCVLCVLVVFFIGALLAYDIRDLRQQLRQQAGSPVLGVLSR